MKNKSYSIPLAILTRKFYCGECGERLIRETRRRTVKRGDPDYGDYSHIGRMHMVGDVEVTAYVFKCLSCGKTISFDEQCVVEKIQKYVGRRTLSQAEVAAHTQRACLALARKRRALTIIAAVLGLMVGAFAMYMWLK